MIGFRTAARALPLLIFCGAAAAAEASWRSLLEQAELLSEQNKEWESVPLAQRALTDAERSLGPEAPEIGHILSRLSVFYMASGATARLPELENRLSAIKSKDSEIWIALAALWRDDGKLSEAEDALKKDLALKPDDPEAEDALTGIYNDMGRFEDQSRLLKDRIAMNPRDYALYSQLAKTYMRLGRSAEAKQAYAQAKKINGKTADAYIQEGYFYMDSDRPAQAARDFESAIAVDTSSPFGYHHMGSYLAQRQRYPEAERYLRQALEKLEADPNATPEDLFHTMARLGNVIQAQGRYAEAETVYLKILEKPQSGALSQTYTLRALARLYVAEGRGAQAEKAYKRFMAACDVRFRCRSDGAGEARIELGQFYLSQGRKAEAETMAEQAAKAYEGVLIDQGLFSALKYLSVFYTKLGDVSKAEALYARLMPMRRTMPFNPDLVWVETGLAGMAAARGRLQDAESHYRQAIELLDHNSHWKEEADALDDLAAIDEKEGTHEADAARAQAKSLRARQ